MQQRLQNNEEEQTNTVPVWKPSEHIPLPPQLAEQKAKAEAIARAEQLIRQEAERERQAHEELKRRAQARLNEYNQAQVPPQQKQQHQTCAACNRPAYDVRTGVAFTFCHHCGAELNPVKPRPQRVQATEDVQTHTYAFGQQQTVTRNTETEVTKSPAVAWAVVSFFFPGVGQFINGQVVKGALLLILSAVLSATLGGAFAIPVLIGRLFSAFDAYILTKKKDEGQKLKAWQWCWEA